MMEQDCETFLSGGLSDWWLAGLNWDENDLIIDMVPPGAGELSNVKVRCVWAHNIVVQMQFDKYAGRPMLWEANVRRDPKGNYIVKLDFGGSPNGFLELTCSDLAFV